MGLSKYPAASVGGLTSAWLHLSQRLLWALLNGAEERTEGAADVVKDTLLDLGSRGTDDVAESEGGLLPLLDPEQMVAALRGDVEQVIRTAAMIINEDPCGLWPDETRERVTALFAALGQDILDRALDLRVSAAEAELRPHSSPGEWTKKYRRMLAAEGRWPPALDCCDDGRGAR